MTVYYNPFVQSVNGSVAELNLCCGVISECL